MARMNSSADHMFRSGQISGKAWKRLKPNGHPGKFKSQHGRMAEFESKEKDEGNTKRKSTSATTSRNIDRNQTMGTPARGGGKPSHGGAVHGSHKSPTTRAINENQKPLFPHQGGGKSRKTLSKQQPSSSQPVGPAYGGPSGRPEKPARL